MQLVTPGSPYTSRMKKKKIKKKKEETQGMGAAALLRCHLPALREATTSEPEQAREPSKLKGTWRSSHRGRHLEVNLANPNPDPNSCLVLQILGTYWHISWILH